MAAAGRMGVCLVFVGGVLHFRLLQVVPALLQEWLGGCLGMMRLDVIP